jgi:peptide deformylase
MSIKKIIEFPHPTLKQKARPIKDFDKDLHLLIDDMLETMRAAPGVGLAAPQIGISKQLAVIEYSDEENENLHQKTFVIVNPEITKTSKSKISDIEACLSVPQLAGEVERFESVTIKAQNQYGHPIKIKAKGWLARIFQHEIDHLNGVLYIDRATNIFQPTPEELGNIRD